MDLRAYVEERFSAVSLIYSFFHWLFHWKWVILAIGFGLSMTLFGEHLCKSKGKNYSFCLTANSLPAELVRLHDIEAILSVELKNPVVRGSFNPNLVSSDVKFVQGGGGESSDMLVVTLTMERAGDVDSISKCLHAWVFERTYLKKRIQLKQEEVAMQIRALDTMINRTQAWIDYIYTNLVTKVVKSSMVQTRDYGETVSTLVQNLNSFVMRRTKLRAELEGLSSSNLTLGDLHEQVSQRSIVRFVLSVFAAWVVLFFVSMLIWLISYSYKVSAAAVQMQQIGAHELGVQKE